MIFFSVFFNEKCEYCIVFFKCVYDNNVFNMPITISKGLNCVVCTCIVIITMYLFLDNLLISLQALGELKYTLLFKKY